ncbi:hypothetical protein LTR70_009719 [Exophiala xenobiotica]|uniref:Major facilitator superfamily (MFS) profile domain-containing protein n=1 Tax=Lithohypha guttulata TaxID=1690604 RepID=A0ABR0JWD4_9EURO|nr:hypothetical protein LTR24_009635 [Lithohypha guttulata]KAK5310129.1 hypothetical protein LTR70_009719 [Exophiala xenobiotica]
MSKPVTATSGLGHQMSPTDPDNPMNWPFLRRVYASMVATVFAFTVAFGLTSYTIGIPGVITDFNVSMTLAIVPFSLYLVGIAFAPIYTPHLSERFGRSPIYLVSLPLCALFILGASRSQSITALSVCRFFAGFSGGPCLVLIEGTYADVWSSKYTVAYYSVLTLASYLGAACGPVVCGYVFASTSWRWTQYASLMVALASFLLGIGMPETYPREIVRTRARRAGRPHNLAAAQSGVTIPQMAQITILTPMVMFVSEPIVIMSTLYVSFLFGTIFQWFISVPAVLGLVYGFTVQQASLAFTSAIAGSLFAATTASLIEKLVIHFAARKRLSRTPEMLDIEYRLIPAMLGGVLMTASFFWIGWTAAPSVHYLSPILGTWIYVWGNMLTLISYISYLFDAYPPAGTLSALTVAASMRLLVAAAIPLCIIPMITNLGGGKTFSVFGALSAALIAITLILFSWGAKLRASSRYSNGHLNMVMVTGAVDEEAKVVRSTGAAEDLEGRDVSGGDPSHA